MCGIYGYTGKNDATGILLGGLKRLEYRGYDSAGIALSDSEIKTVKAVGRVSCLEEKLTESPLYGATCGIGHTRWATHGAVTEENCHPHISFDGKIALVHNGTIENWREIKAFLLRKGIIPSGDTDSELLAHLIAVEYEKDNLLEAVRKTLTKVKGSYALAVIAKGEREIVAARKNSPLIVGRKSDGTYLSSDIPALYGCDEVYIMEENDIAVLYEGGALFYNGGKNVIRKSEVPVGLNEENGLAGHEYYMHKEIYDIPKAVSDTYRSLISEEEKIERICRSVEQCDEILFIGCGTAYHAGAVASYLFGKRLGKRTGSILASEFIYFTPNIGRNTLCFFVSQSGETADTLKALKIARDAGAKTVAVTNVRYSSICSSGGIDIYTLAGREVAVASTKAYSAQLTVFFAVLQRLLLKRKGKTDIKNYDAITQTEMRLRLTVAQADEEMRKFSRNFSQNENVFMIGRGTDYITACEGALKMKEISLIPCQALPAGELKHGTLSLIDEGVKVIAIVTQKAIRDKMPLAIAETKARGAEVTVISQFKELSEISDRFIELPCVAEETMPVFSIIPLQLLAFHSAVFLGHSPDKPRNLAKSVTVE